MNLRLERQELNDICTIGRLFVDGDPECWTLEDVVRDTKLKGQTAIPFGRYEVVITFSQRFGRPLPLLLKVPDFEGVRIHPGNDANDTEGCILVGKRKGANMLYESREAFSLLMLRLQRAMQNEKVFIEIVKGTK
jgi:hypothetical protein